jgi:hypothetical protein
MDELLSQVLSKAGQRSAPEVAVTSDLTSFKTAVRTGFAVQAMFLEDYPIKDYPPPNLHVFWREGPVSQRRTYGVHLYFPSGVYREGKGSYVYWHDTCYDLLEWTPLFLFRSHVTDNPMTDSDS